MAKRNKNRKAVILLLILTLLLTLASCGGDKTEISENGEALKLTFKEIDEEGIEGIFVMNKDETFTPVLTDMPGFSGETDKADPARYIWYSNPEGVNIDSLIPSVKKGGKLVAIYNSKDSIPKKWYLEKYTSKGYTVGFHVTLDEAKDMYIIRNDTLSGTSAEMGLSQLASSDDVFAVEKISGSNHLPIENVDTNMEIFLGLQEGKVYTFTFYRGTKTENMDVIADTKVFQSTRYVNIQTPYKKTDQGYFIINLPTNLKQGYYYISDIGMFKYED